MAGSGHNGKLIIDVVTELQAEFKKFNTEFNNLKDELGKKGVDVPVNGKFDDFRQELKSIKAEAAKDPVYIDVRVNETKFRGELGKIESAIKSMQRKLEQTPIELKTSLDGNFLSGIEKQLINIQETVRDVSNALRTSEQLQIISDREVKKLEDAKNDLSGILSYNKSAFKTSGTDAFYNKAVKQFKNLAKYRGSFFEAADIKEVLNDTGAMGLSNALRLMLSDLAEAKDASKELNKAIQFGEGKDEIISYRDALSLVINALDEYRDKSKALQGTVFTSGIFEDLRKMIDASEEFNRTQKEMASVKQAEVFKQDQVQKIEQVTKAFTGLDALVEKLSASLNVISSATSGGTPFHIDEAQLKGITQVFENLKNVLTELSNTLKTGIDFSQFTQGVEKVAETTRKAKDASKKGTTTSSGGKMFLDPKKDAEEYERASKAAAKYKKEIGDIQKISRISKGDNSTYEVIGKTGRLNLAQDQKGNLVIDQAKRARQEIENNAAIQRQADEAQAQRLAKIEQRKEQIRKLDKEIFDQEQRYNKMLANKADPAILAKQKEVIAEKKMARKIANNYVRRGYGGPNSQEYKDFTAEVAKANAEREREVQIANEAARASKAVADAKRAEAEAQRKANNEAERVRRVQQTRAERAAAPLTERDTARLQKLVNDTNELRNKLDDVKSNTAFDSLRNDVEALDQSVDELVADLGKVSSKGELTSVGARFAQLKESIRSTGVIDAYSREQSLRSGINSTIANNLQPLAESDKYTSKFKQEVQEAIDELRRLGDSATNIEELQHAFDSAGKSADKFSNQAKDAALASSGSIEKLRLKIDKFTADNTNMGRRFRQSFENLKIRLEGAELTDHQLKEIANDFIRLEAEAYRFNRTGTSVFDTLRGRIKQMSTNFVAMYFSFYDIARYTRELFNSVKEFDTALTEMRKVSDESISTLKSFQQESFGTANAVGTTALALQQSTADWLRLGESISEAKKSAETTTVLLNVSEFENVDEATEALVAASQAYNDLEKLDIVDKLNIIGNNFSISTDQLAQGLQNAAAVLRTQGNSIEEALALLTSGNAITQNISKASAGVRTIALRIAGTEEAKDQLIEMGEDADDFIVATHAKMQELIKDYTAVASNAYEGVDILDANGNLKSTYQILLEISRVYQEILDTDKQMGTNRGQALVEAIAGE